MNIAIIPARSGSKRIKNKNLKNFYNKPIIYWAIKTALSSKLFDEVIVSTDSKKIKFVAEKYGAKVPFLRPKNLANDFATTRQVIKHSVNFFDKKISKVKSFCCIYPTAPLLEKKQLISAFKIFKKFKQKKYVFSAVRYSYPIQRGFYMNSYGKVIPIDKTMFNKRSQDLKIAYHDAGQFYIGSPDILKKNINIYSKEAYPIILNEDSVQDIDTISDWKIAELKFKNKFSN